MNYIIFIFEINYIHDSFKLKELTNLIDNRASLGFSHFDLEISEKAFEKMVITLGPRLNPGDKELVEALVSNYNPKAKIIKSDLTGKIR